MKVAIIGTGPAGLMAATEVAAAGYHVDLIEKRPGAGRKLFIAGGSGLNISNSLPLDRFINHYSGSFAHWPSLLREFSPTHWLSFIHDLGLETFEGTSGRYFVTTMNAALLVRAWKKRLASYDTTTYLQLAVEDFDYDFVTQKTQLKFGNSLEGPNDQYEAVCFALGGGSYEPDEKPLRWPKMFRDKGVALVEFAASNVGHQVAWPEALLKEAEGEPIKNVVLSSSRGQRAGDLVITSYGIEGTPVYTVGEIGVNFIDLKPDLTLDQLRERTRKLKENLSPIRRVQKTLKLSKGAEALLFHLTQAETRNDLDCLLHAIKKFPLQLIGRQSLDESISSSGGVVGTELTEQLMLQKFPGIFLAGEMIDWDAPTGGFLLQGCVAMGKRAGQSIVNYLKTKHEP